jgi:hypothetical protein
MFSLMPTVCTHFHHYTCRCTLSHGGDGTQITIWRWLYKDETDFHRFASIEILIGNGSQVGKADMHGFLLRKKTDFHGF